MLEVRPQNIGCFLLMEGFKQGCTRCQQGYIWRDLDTEVNADPRFQNSRKNPSNGSMSNMNLNNE